MALDIEFTSEHHPGRWILAVIILIVLLAAGWFGYKWYTTGDLPFTIPVASANSGVNEADVSVDDVKSYSVPAQNPRYITIPTLHLNKTRIYAVGLDSNNMIKIPTNVHDVSWYEKSGTPGEGGVILMDGHNVGVNRNGAFYGLNALTKGQKVTLERGDGKTFSYHVVENKSLTLDEVNNGGMAMMGKSAEPGNEGLNLMTFDGKWVPRLGTYDHRTMVRTVIDSNS